MQNINTPKKGNPPSIKPLQMAFLLCLGLCLVAVFCFLVQRDASRITEYFPAETAQDQSKMEYSMDAIEYNEVSGCYVVQGWAFLPGESIETYDCHIVIRTDSGKYYQIPTQYQVRTDINTAYATDGFAYQSSGFKAMVSKEKLEEYSGDNTSYTVCIAYKNNDNDFLIETEYLL